MGEQNEDELPRALDVLWRRVGRQLREPRQRLTLDRIVDAAIEIADTEGLPALSMAHLAERLGCATMSLYRHVANKDELHVLMMDIAPGAPPRVDAGAGWREGLARWARELRTLYYRHPWILQITVDSPPLEPGQLAWLDRGLSTLQHTNLAPAEKLSVIMLLLHYVRGEAQLSPGVHTRLPASYGRLLAKLVDPARFPSLAELIAAGTFEGDTDPAGVTPDFDFGLLRIIDGVEVMIDTRAPERRVAHEGSDPL